MWLKAHRILDREVRGNEIGCATDSIDHRGGCLDVLLLQFDPCGLEKLVGCIRRAIDRRKVEEVLQGGVHQGAHDCGRSWSLWNPIDGAESKEQRAGGEVAYSRGRERTRKVIGTHAVSLCR
jgi:hypothetical protein